MTQLIPCESFGNSGSLKTSPVSEFEKVVPLEGRLFTALHKPDEPSICVVTNDTELRFINRS